MAALSGRKCRPLLALMLLLAVTIAAERSAFAQHVLPSEYQVKSVFLFHFTRFIEWPASAFEAPGAPLVICVLGDDPFGTYLDETVRNESVGGHPLSVRRVRRLDAVDACHIVFVSNSEAGRTNELRRRLMASPTLTVADLDDFAVTGGMVQFVTEEGKIRFRINVDSARAAGLTISSKLLSLADIVTDGGS